MSLIDRVKEIESKYQAGQDIFRRTSVGFLLERISQLEQSAKHSVHTDGACTCTPDAIGHSYDCPAGGNPLYSQPRR